MSEQVQDTAGRECAGCGLRCETKQCGTDAEPTNLGLECGCLQAFSAAMGLGWTWRGAAAWAKARREGKP
jgi:hypothetical protein